MRLVWRKTFTQGRRRSSQLDFTALENSSGFLKTAAQPFVIRSIITFGLLIFRGPPI